MNIATNDEVEKKLPVLCPHYYAAMNLIAEVDHWARAGSPGATLEDLVIIANDAEPTRLAVPILQRAERNLCGGTA